MNELSRVFSFGGGQQSVAVMVLAAQGKLNFEHFVFANVGEHAENPDTIKYVQEIVIPYAQANNLHFVEVQKTRRNGDKMDLYNYALAQPKGTVLPVWVRQDEKGRRETAPGRRACTSEFKIRVVDKYIRFLSRSVPMSPPMICYVGLGISTDEWHRAKKRDPQPLNKKETLFKQNIYPLLDLKLSRQQCRDIIQAAGLPIPPKSACFFCPYKSLGGWIELKMSKPELFEKAVILEETTNEKLRGLGRPEVTMHYSGYTLSEGVPDQMALFDINDQDNCESGYCHT